MYASPIKNKEDKKRNKENISGNLLKNIWMILNTKGAYNIIL